MLRPLAAGMLAGLALAAPAGAVSGGYGASTALHQGHVVTVKTTVTSRDRHSCQKNNERAGGLGKSFYPVACEQPPRSGANVAGQLNQIATSALAALG